MKRFHDYLWPDTADANVMRYIHHADDMRSALHYTKGRDAVVQAGGHCGIWPLWLSKRFAKVYTFEPIAANWECLHANCARPIATGRIFPVNACLGEYPSHIAMRVNQKNTGGHKGTQEPGETPVVTIDGLQLAACDLIVLDVEGMELPALKGAVATLDAYKPTLMLEDRGHGDRHGWGGRDALYAWLKERGYEVRAKVSYDVVLTCADRG